MANLATTSDAPVASTTRSAAQVSLGKTTVDDSVVSKEALINTVRSEDVPGGMIRKSRSWGRSGPTARDLGAADRPIRYATART